MPSRKIPQSETRPCALSIAGSDSGGGAGIQADLRTFSSIGVHGTTAITCVTAQNPREVRSVEPISPINVQKQIESVLAELAPKAIKTGMLFSSQIINVVSDTLAACDVPLVVDPVMISTSGALLLKSNAVTALKRRLLPKAALITPNLAEAEYLLQRQIRTPEQLRDATREFHTRYGCAVLGKGGHLSGRSAVDFFFDGTVELLLESPRITGISTHGTGCTYSAAITAHLALGRTLIESVVAAKGFITRAISRSYKCGRHFVLNNERAT